MLLLILLLAIGLFCYENLLLCFAIEIDLKKANRIFAQHFLCGSSVTWGNEVVVQGDVTDDIIQGHCPEVGASVIIYHIATVEHL